MKIIIEIPNFKFDNDVKDKFQDYFNRVKADIADGTLCGNYELETTDMFLASFKRLQVLPDNATNGNMIKAMFSPLQIRKICRGEMIEFTLDGVVGISVTKEWWNAPYKKESE